jgi:tetratricopeptide (TPR) repeat protein
MAIILFRICPGLLALLCFFPDTIFAQAAVRCSAPIGEILSVQGSVELKSPSENSWHRVAIRERICPGDAVRVGLHSRAMISFLSSGRNMRLDEQTTLLMDESGSGSGLINILKGAIFVSARKIARAAFGKPGELDIKTPFVDGKVTGTEFFVRVETDCTLVTVLEGNLELKNELGRLLVAANQSAVARLDQAPQIRIVVKPRDAVQWAMYYQPVLEPQTEASPPNLAKALQESFEAFRSSDLNKAFELLDQTSETDRNADYYIQRAGLLLAAGQLDQARSCIDRAFSLSPGNGQAFALSTVIAVALNDREQALLNGRKAVEQSPGSAAALIALSYGLQANFKLKEALNALLEAVKKQPNDAEAWARLAELQLSLGSVNKALDAAQKAISTRPDLSRAHSMLGFVYLAQTKTSKAMAAFEKAISLESESPLARLGFGLARIREGDLAEGRQEIEIASVLAPNDAIIRSYLGKAYYEEKRNALAATQLILAKELDPRDPTPFFYDAIRKQTVNRPIEALNDLQKSIELNNNRAVYRSRLLMDEDLASRSASLGRIYRDLGFEQLALVQGWNSLNLDPANYSAHRFLADSYSALPRHEIARVSELLQSQLRQPINMTPLQPQLTENDLFILSGAGPSEMAFNEFNPLFARNRLALQANAIGGANGTFGNDAVVSGVQGRLSFSAGQYHYQTDGFRENADQEQNIYNAYVQASLSDKTSIQAEFRSADIWKGDLALRFDPTNYSASQRNKDSRNTYRFGLHQTFTPSSDAIASVIVQHSDLETIENYAPFGDIVLQNTANSLITEMQYLYRSSSFSVLSGAGHFRADVNKVQDIFGAVFNDKPDQYHTNAYTYFSIPYPKNITLTAGTSVDFYKDDNLDRQQINPKLGLTWKPRPKTTIRAAAFRTLKRSLVASQTIEPTQIAGFNQFYDDEDGADTRRFGVAVDHAFTTNLFAGGEISKRDLRLTRFNPLNASPIRFKWNEHIDRVYLYWAPHQWIAVTAEYQYERFERPSPATVIILNSETKLETHRVPVSLGLYHPSGLSAWLRATYIDQCGEFVDSQAQNVRGQDDFGVLDGAISYRLPQRHGMVTFGAKNIFNKSFLFQDVDVRNASLYPARMIYSRLTLAF